MAALRTILIFAVSTLASSTAPAATPDRVKVADFRIDRTEVTIGAYREFAARLRGGTKAEREGGGFEYGAGWERRLGWVWHSPYGKAGSDNEPVTHITWAEATTYCAHVGGRLPTWDEWRKAAYNELRGAPTDGLKTGQTYPYPVGETPDGMNNSRRRHVPVATTKRGVNGLYDMGANVWEWTADRRGNEALTAGGSWWYGPEQTREGGSQWKPADFYAIYIGFRCAYDHSS